MKIYSNSQLVINQINDTYETRGPIMALYLVEAKQMIINILTFSIEQIPSKNNMTTNALFKLITKGHPQSSREIITKTLTQMSIHKESSSNHIYRNNLDMNHSKVS